MVTENFKPDNAGPAGLGQIIFRLLLLLVLALVVGNTSAKEGRGVENEESAAG